MGVLNRGAIHTVARKDETVTIRSEFRVTPWHPRFGWVTSIPAVADAINRPHDDYPRRVPAAEREIERLGGARLPPTITTDALIQVHAAVFADTDFAGRMKKTDVFLGREGKPKVSKFADLMRRLEAEYADQVTSLDNLREWYIDFQTIHPFPDGNGRTGGIMVAVYSHQMCPTKGWLGPKQ